MLNDALPLARHVLNRDASARADESLLARLRASNATRVLAVHAGTILRAQQRDGSEPAIAWLNPFEVPDAAIWLFLAPNTLAAVLTTEQAEQLEPEALRWAGLRSLATELTDEDNAYAVEAVALANWHESHGFCPRCGAATEVIKSGWVRRCPVENSELFPRTDAAVIVRITDSDDRLLLGSNVAWEKNRYSLLAGFVDPGESLEAAVVREVFEESGVRIVEPRYLGSQPWPFPASLMVGFEAKLAVDQSPEATLPDGEEIIELRWFSRDDVRSAGESVLLPGPISIAGAMIREWLDAEPSGASATQSAGPNS